MKTGTKQSQLRGIHCTDHSIKPRLIRAHWRCSPKNPLAEPKPCEIGPLFCPHPPNNRFPIRVHPCSHAAPESHEGGSVVEIPAKNKNHQTNPFIIHSPATPCRSSQTLSHLLQPKTPGGYARIPLSAHGVPSFAFNLQFSLKP
jgi:hypothetical protein